MFIQNGKVLSDSEAAHAFAEAIKAELGILEEETKFLSSVSRKREREGYLSPGKLKTNDDRCAIPDKTKEALPIGKSESHTKTAQDDDELWSELH